MPYRAKETIHTDVNPLADTFDGKLLPETEGNYVIKGKGGILSDADAEKYGLAGSNLVEKLEEGQAEREQDERNLATVGAQERAMANPDPQPVAPKASEPTGAKAEQTDELKSERKAVLTSKGTVKAATKSRK